MPVGRKDRSQAFSICKPVMVGSKNGGLFIIISTLGGCIHREEKSLSAISIVTRPWNGQQGFAEGKGERIGDLDFFISFGNGVIPDDRQGSNDKSMLFVRILELFGTIRSHTREGLVWDQLGKVYANPIIGIKLFVETLIQDLLEDFGLRPSTFNVDGLIRGHGPIAIGRLFCVELDGKLPSFASNNKLVFVGKTVVLSMGLNFTGNSVRVNEWTSVHEKTKGN